jgi:hypothetical protein
MRRVAAALAIALLLAAAAGSRVLPLRRAAPERRDETTLVEVAGKAELGPAMSLVVIPLLVGLSVNTLYDAAKGGVGQCSSLLSGDIDTTSREHISNELIKWCPEQEMVWDPASGANTEKQWHVHARGGGITMLGKCEFKFNWEPKASGRLYDCRVGSIERKMRDNGEPDARGKLQQLLQQHPQKHFQRHIKGMNIEVTDCRSSYHKSYVSTFVGLPYAAFSPDQATKDRYSNNPYLYFVVQGWTGGDCSGSKEPGVQWSFPYKVNLSNGIITKAWGKDANNRPTFPERIFVPKVGAHGRSDPFEVKSYEERTNAQCGKLGICR